MIKCKLLTLEEIKELVELKKAHIEGRHKQVYIDQCRECKKLNQTKDNVGN